MALWIRVASGKLSYTRAVLLLAFMAVTGFILFQACVSPHCRHSKASQSSTNGARQPPLTLAESYPLIRTAFPTTEEEEEEGGNHSCADSVCTELLSPEDMASYKCRGMKYITAVNRCRFMSGQGRAAVALVSFPGSGNTWVRGLLERATGICTGSVYCDGGLRSGGFIGEGFNRGSVLVVKTHSGRVDWTDRDKPVPDSRRNPVYGAAILIVRNPFNALVAEWTRESFKFLVNKSKGSKHTSQPLGPEYFRDYQKWDTFLQGRINKWQGYFTKVLLGADGHDVLVVRFEDIKKDSLPEIKRMLDFLGVPYSEEILKHRLEQDFGLFKRPPHEMFDHFTAEQKSLIRSEIQKASQKLKEFGDGGTLGLEEYIQGPS